MKTYFITVLVFAFLSGALVAADRVALVIGNSDYGHVRDLPNATSDSEAVASMLKDAGFEIIRESGQKTLSIQNANVESTYAALENFAKAAVGARVGLVYYAGHGLEVDGQNYLLPVDARLETQTQLRTQAVPLDAILAEMKKTGLPAKMVILDCCRDNPLSRSWMSTRSTSGGLAEIEDSKLPDSTLIMLSTAPGKTALDGTGSNSPFTKALLKHLPASGASVYNAFVAVSDQVAEETNDRQIPWLKTDGAARTFRALTLRGGDASGRPQPVQPGRVAMQEPPPANVAVSEEMRHAPGESKEILLPGEKRRTARFRWCPPGKFTMGSPELETGRTRFEQQRVVSIERGFWIGETEFTSAQWNAVVGEMPSEFPGGNAPVENISWEDADVLVTTLCILAPVKGWQWALPTEEQWEYACRAGSSEAFCFGNDGSQLHKYGNFADKQYSGPGNTYRDPSQDDGIGNMTSAVGDYLPNHWGILDMHGNVWEWCKDESKSDFSDQSGVVFVGEGELRVLRGGSWNSAINRCRSASRRATHSTYTDNSIGFRPVLVPSMQR